MAETLLSKMPAIYQLPLLREGIVHNITNFQEEIQLRKLSVLSLDSFSFLLENSFSTDNIYIYIYTIVRYYNYYSEEKFNLFPSLRPKWGGRLGEEKGCGKKGRSVGEIESEGLFSSTEGKGSNAPGMFSEERTISMYRTYGVNPSQPIIKEKSPLEEWKYTPDNPFTNLLMYVFYKSRELQEQLSSAPATSSALGILERISLLAVELRKQASTDLPQLVDCRQLIQQVGKVLVEEHISNYEMRETGLLFAIWQFICRVPSQNKMKGDPGSDDEREEEVKEIMLPQTLITEGEYTPLVNRISLFISTLSASISKTDQSNIYIYIYCR